jgi:hypothetical protein
MLPEPLREAFHLTGVSLIDGLREHSHKSRTLAQLRDLLVPTLVSGEMHVHGADKLGGERR